MEEEKNPTIFSSDCAQKIQE